MVIVGFLGVMVALIGPAQATPVHAATITVGCTRSLYSGPTGIQDAVNAAPISGANITVCAGIYNPVNVTKDNIHLKGVGNPIIRPAAAGFVGHLVGFGEVDNASIEGFTIDGNFSLSSTATDSVRGILFFRSSGVISKNNIIHIRRDPVGSDDLAIGIDIQNGLPGTPLNVKVSGNTVYDYQHIGISVFGNIKPTIQKNVVATGTNDSRPIGIQVNAVVGGTISGNIVQSDYFHLTTGSTGISVAQSSKIKVTSNKLRALTVGVELINWCPLTAFTHTSDNLVMSNTMTQVFNGVVLQGIDNISMGTACDGIVDNNKVTKNKQYAMGFEGNGAVLLLYTLGGSIYSPQVTNNMVTGNIYYGYGVDIADSSGGVNTTTPNTLQLPQPGIYP
jgi:hypothetical protein